MVTKDESRMGMADIPIFVAALLPFGGLIALNWRLPETLFVYWIEIGLFLILYTGLVLFAQREPQPEDRMLNLATIPIPFLSSRSGTVQLASWLPPIYYRNVKYAAGFFPFALFFWVFSGDLLLAHSDPGFHYSTRGSRGVPIEQSLSVIQSAFSPEGLGMGVLLFSVRLLVVHREFFSRRQYENLSAPMVVEIPFRIGAFWSLLVVITTVSLPFVVLPLLSDFGVAKVTKSGVLLVVIFGKFTMELAVSKSRQPEGPSGLIRWLTPEI